MKRLDNAILAPLLEEAKSISRNDIIKTSDMKRDTLFLLRKDGWLTDIIKVWCMLIRQDGNDNPEIAWRENYWGFLSAYLDDRFGKRYCISPEISLNYLTGANQLPKQLLVNATTGGQSKTDLPHGYSIFTSRVAEHLFPKDVQVVDGLRVQALEAALCGMPAGFYTENRPTASAALVSADVSKLARVFAAKEAPDTGMDRIYTGLHEINRGREAETFVALLNAAKIYYKPKKIDFNATSAFINTRSPYAARIQLLWSNLREDVEKTFDGYKPKIEPYEKVIASVSEAYTHDAYHSLSIEGYKVSREMIDKIAKGLWNPDTDDNDKNHIAAMAAKGYFDAFRSVKSSIKRCFEGEKVADVVNSDVPIWRTLLFSQSITAGILSASDLIGYRQHPVYIKNSQHCPPHKDAIMDCMDAFSDCLRAEKNPAVQAVLGHLVFTYIHPYPDGNGRLGRFIMNTCLTTSGYPWTVIRSESDRREKYMASLESASIHQKITPFAEFVLEEMKVPNEQASLPKHSGIQPDKTRPQSISHGKELPGEL